MAIMQRGVALARLDHAVDLRRRRSREAAETMIDRARLLPPDDRALIEAVFRDGLPVARIAALATGDSEPADHSTRARTLRRRIRRLTTRLLSREYAFVAEQLADWSPTRRRVATACVLHGRSIRNAADELRLSLHTVRCHRAAIAELVEAWS
ncbi:MAG: hypothetical protein DYG93_06245 [Leptolyngbya sp. PLA2]|nr:hypothetical protein [Leptolyngbya sp.]MCE7971248.1 hypothetical protein [Leptolyngbya sp. PL-A2]MCQ3939606.1 hypothetical protein [cyanobacterium CYA1]MCZ7632151.1 hypothetical protein [Phycisphaerales bacterium]MDL1903862.1 hypothetical protein [Synechococcales cyanobacterium CNB]GIK18576.1 MAG: hypothetical protein BroJett004_07400 [Planctomycetota bacterium]